MTTYLTVKQYVEASGLPEDLVRRLTRCSLANDFSFRASAASNAPIYINVQKLEKMLHNGQLKEVLEG